ncbi:MAG: phenylalanine--tRNA ligase subunit beta [Patescibacteria group bacterium]|nr:phenylalanine--tRNA ligase subunit beta [Patescibacteria group bacterium]
MKISYNWLKDYVEIEKTPEELASDLSSFGFTLESLKKIGNDFVLDLEINPNRGDCLSVLGIAREVAALYKYKVRSMKYEVSEEEIDKDVKIVISDPKICPRFTARIIDNLEIKPSPKWLQERLMAYGFRPINNLVDITNYVMVAMGQPLHAFDLGKIKNGQMNIRLANDGEELMTLDGKNRKLLKDTIVISDDEKIYDLAGIMGGFASEVDEKTKTIVLQGAVFDPVLIRRSSKKLAHTTDASYRYERGVDYNNTIFGVNMAATLIKESCPEAKIGKLVDIKSEILEERKIQIEPDKINALLGTKLSIAKMQEYLKRLSFESSNDGKLIVTVPSFRFFDVTIWQDVAEEIARIYGYDKIIESEFLEEEKKSQNKDWQRREEVKDTLKNIGFTEIYSYSLVDKGEIEIENPLSVEMRYFRSTLIPSMLGAVARNPWSPEIAIFEVGKVFCDRKEWWQVGIAGSSNVSHLIKKAIEKLSLKEEVINVDQETLDFYKIRRGVKVITFTLDEINLPIREVSDSILENQYREVSKFPPTIRDLAFIIDENVQADLVGKTIEEISEKILIIELFDEFKSDKFGENKKNLAYHIWLQDLKGPISDEETNIIFKNIIKTIEEKFQATLRR